MVNEERRNIQTDVINTFEKNNFNGFAEVPTGTGKAWILIQILKYLKPKSVWYLCDSTMNRDETFKNELIKWGAKKWIDKIEFMCYQTACKLKDYKVDLLLADEADFSLSPKYSQVYFNNKFKHKVLISGTISANKYDILEKAKIPVVYAISIDEVEQKGVLNKANYYLVNYLLNKDENAKYLYFNRTFAKYMNANMPRSYMESLQINRKHFMSKLTSSLNVCRRLMKHLYEKDKKNKILVFCGLSEQADAVCKHSYHSKTDNKAFENFDKGVLRVLSVVSKADRGLNINGVNVIILESPSRSATKFFQRTGRGRRLHVDEELDVYFLIPYFKDTRGTTRPTIVLDWVHKSAAKIENFKPIIYKFND